MDCAAICIASEPSQTARAKQATPALLQLWQITMHAQSSAHVQALSVLRRWACYAELTEAPAGDDDADEDLAADLGRAQCAGQPPLSQEQSTLALKDAEPDSKLLSSSTLSATCVR